MPYLDLSELDVPQLILPFPAREYPQAQEICDKTDQWMRDIGLVPTPERERHLIETQISRWFPAVVPYGDYSTVLLGSRFLALATISEDWIAEQHGISQGNLAAAMAEYMACERIGRTLQRDSSSEAILPTIVHDLNQQLRDIATPDQVLRIQYHFMQFFLASSTEAAHTNQGLTPEIAAYKRIRELTACMAPFFTLSEIARGLHTPLETLMRPETMQLTALAGILSGISNDVIGLRRDLSRDDTMIYPSILAHHQHCTFQEAVYQMVDEFHRDVEEFVRRAEALCVADPRHGPGWVEVLQDAVAGNVAWEYYSMRYTMEGWHR
ncbi:terpene synthase family protein [Streptomyces sp. NPDC001985]|uniref:terpene synthase family protein n=1 Tax=Streptomyces sp. NPDC001985 TaxID=3154406 RepID=UPI00332FBBA2